MKPLLFSILFLLLIFSCSRETKQMKSLQQEAAFEKVVAQLKFPEGPAWDRERNMLYVSNCQGDWITRITPAGNDVFLKASEKPFTFGKTNGLTVAKDGSIFACDFGIGAIVKFSPEGQSGIYASGFERKPFNRPNDLAFDPQGNLYFTDPNKYDPENRDGVVYFVERQSKKVTLAAKDLAFPNGLAFSADGKFLFLCESALHRVLKLEVQADGTLAKPVVFAEMPGGDPDGCNFDGEGNLYVAHFGGGAIWVFAPDGSLKTKLSAPGAKPSNVEFGGEDLKTLFITEDETNAVYKTRVEIAGLPLF